MLKRFGFNKPSSGLWGGEKCCWNSDGFFVKITREEKKFLIKHPLLFK